MSFLYLEISGCRRSWRTKETKRRRSNRGTLHKGANGCSIYNEEKNVKFFTHSASLLLFFLSVLINWKPWWLGGWIKCISLCIKSRKPKKYNAFILWIRRSYGDHLKRMNKSSIWLFIWVLAFSIQLFITQIILLTTAPSLWMKKQTGVSID